MKKEIHEALNEVAKLPRIPYELSIDYVVTNKLNMAPGYYCIPYNENEDELIIHGALTLYVEFSNALNAANVHNLYLGLKQDKVLGLYQKFIRTTDSSVNK